MKNIKAKNINIEGTKKKSSKLGALLCGLAALCCITYCMVIMFVLNFGTYFFLIWGCMAVFFAVLSFLLATGKIKAIPKWIRKIFAVGCVVGLILFVMVEGIILSGFTNKAKSGADYVIILGAQWKTSGPSIVLKERLDRAIEYLNENPETKVIVSGGKGSNEPISEADGMGDYLIAHGIAADRICREDKSTSTEENLKFSKAFCNIEEDSIVIISSNYHVYRAGKIAEKMGYKNVEGLAAPSSLGMLPNNMLREFFAMLKDFIVGNI